MKRYVVMLLVLVLSSFVVAQGSEISANFNVGIVDEGKDYVPPAGLWDVYGSYIIGLLVVAIVLLIIVLRKKKPEKKVKHRRVVHRKVKRKVKKK